MGPKGATKRNARRTHTCSLAFMHVRTRTIQRKVARREGADWRERKGLPSFDPILISPPAGQSWLPPRDHYLADMHPPFNPVLRRNLRAAPVVHTRSPFRRVLPQMRSHSGAYNTPILGRYQPPDRCPVVYGIAVHAVVQCDKRAPRFATCC